MLITFYKHTRSELEICSTVTRIKPRSAAFQSFHNKAGKAIQAAEARSQDAPDQFFPAPSNILQVNIIFLYISPWCSGYLLEIIRWRSVAAIGARNSSRGAHRATHVPTFQNDALQNEARRRGGFSGAGLRPRPCFSELSMFHIT